MVQKRPRNDVSIFFVARLFSIDSVMVQRWRYDRTITRQFENVLLKLSFAIARNMVADKAQSSGAPANT